MNKTQISLLSLLSYKLFSKGKAIELSEPIIKEAKLQAVSSLITKDYQIIANNIRVDAAHAEFTETLKGIPFVILKGYASAYYYPEPTYRVMGDVDFYVAPKHYKSAYQRMIQNGYKQSTKEHERHEAFNKGKVHFELHSEIKGIPNGKDGIKVASPKAEKIVRHYLDDVIKTAQTVETQHGQIIIPDDFHHGLIMLLHVAGHIINDGGVGLRHLCDWAVYADKVDISKYRSQLKEMGLWTFACQLTAVSSKYLGLKKYSWCEKFDNEFLKTFIEDILNAGNFGRKTAGRSTSFNLTQKGNVIKSFASMTQNRYEFCKNYPLLLPVGMIAYIVRYVWNRLTGKAKWVKLTTIKEAKNRKSIYEQFKLFQ